MIEFKNVSKTYENGTQALKNVNMKIENGEFVFVVGSSGAGKSTFLKLIMREEVPSGGTVIIGDYNLNTLKKKQIPYFRRTLGIVFQDFRLIPNMTVFDNVAFAMRVIGAKEKDIRKRVPYVLSLVGLSSKARSLPNQLSGGEQQRVALARSLVNNAGIIVADEPTGNIDPEMSYEIVDLLNHINANGTTVIMVTHEHDLVRRFNRRVIKIENGCVVADIPGTAKFTFTRPEVEKKPEDDSKEKASKEKVEEKARMKVNQGNLENGTTTYYVAPGTDKETEDFINNYSPKNTSSDYSKYIERLDDNKSGGAEK